jgi:hypothetical protein
MVPEWRDQVVTTYKMVPTTETRTVMRKVTTQVPVTTIHRKMVDQGHWETRCVPVREGLCARMARRMRGDCCDPCECPKMREKKVWVSCKVCVEVPCTRMVCKTTCVPETITVCVNKCVPCTETRKVCTHRCVTEHVQETCTVMVRKCVPYTATRCVAKCVPCTENVTCTRMVCKPVTRTVTECATACGSTSACCGDACGCCTTTCCKPARRVRTRCCR